MPRLRFLRQVDAVALNPNMSEKRFANGGGITDAPGMQSGTFDFS